MISEHVTTTKHRVFICSDILHTEKLTSKRGELGMHFKNEPQNNLMLVNMVLACNQFLSVFEVKIGLNTTCQKSILSPTTI